jgi:uncharacterized linocin/CFP29 family protein
MLANTLTLTINSVAKVLTRINQDNFGSEYRLISASERIILKIRHSSTTSANVKFDQHNVLVEWTKIPAAPALPSVLTVSTTLRGQIGTDPAELDYLSDALGVLVAAQLAAIVQGDS